MLFFELFELNAEDFGILINICGGLYISAFLKFMNIYYISFFTKVGLLCAASCYLEQCIVFHHAGFRGHVHRPMTRRQKIILITT